jgi:hypothetical protein
MIFRAREIVARNAAADRRTFESLLLDRGLEHRRREIRELHRQRREGAEAVRLLRAQLGELFVVVLADRLRLVALARYQNGLIDRISMSIAIASMSARRLSMACRR